MTLRREMRPRARDASGDAALARGRIARLRTAQKVHCWLVDPWQSQITNRWPS